MCGGKRILDVGCGTGNLLGDLAGRLPDASLAGIDAAPRMVAPARDSYGKLGAGFTQGVAESLPFATDEFDLVVSTTSFDHWEDQRQGLFECARVLRPSGHFVCVDQFSPLLWPTLLVSRKGKARTKRRLKGLVEQTSFRELRWHDVYTALIEGFSVTKK